MSTLNIKIVVILKIISIYFIFSVRYKEPILVLQNISFNLNLAFFFFFLLHILYKQISSECFMLYLFDGKLNEKIIPFKYVFEFQNFFEISLINAEHI